MKKAFQALLYILFLAPATLFIQCSSGDGSATAQLAFRNETGASAGISVGKGIGKATTPAGANILPATEFKMKLVAAYLSEDLAADGGANVGNTEMVYLNPECLKDDIAHCNVSPGISEDGTPFAYIVTTFFDFGLPLDQVNAALNAQKRSIRITENDTGSTFRYVRLEFCKITIGPEPNVKWDDGTVGEQGFISNNCGNTSAKLDPPLVLHGGDSVTIRLNYDLSGAIQTGTTATGNHCTGTGTAQVCFTIPTFYPSLESVTIGSGS